MSVITDGTGTGSRVKVDSRNRLSVLGTTRDELVEASYDGRAFNINTETLNFTVAGNDVALLYIKNNNASDIVLSNFFTAQTDRTSAAGSDTIKIYGGPSAGTSNDIIANGTNVIAANRRVGTPNEFNILAKAGGEGFDATVSEPPMVFSYNGGFANILVNYVIPTGQSIVVTMDRVATTGKLYTGFNGYISTGA